MKAPVRPDQTLDEYVARFLAAVFGPLGPVQGMNAYSRALDRMEELAASTPSGREIPTIHESATRIIFDAEPLPDYLHGISHDELGTRLADYVDLHESLR